LGTVNCRATVEIYLPGKLEMNGKGRPCLDFKQNLPNMTWLFISALLQPGCNTTLDSKNATFELSMSPHGGPRNLTWITFSDLRLPYKSSAGSSRVLFPVFIRFCELREIHYFLSTACKAWGTQHSWGGWVLWQKNNGNLGYIVLMRFQHITWPVL
jgi:hypothetical protein